MKVHQCMTLLGVGVVLAACSGGEPSEAEIRDAIERQLQQQLAASSDVFNKDDVVVNKIAKVGCASAGEQPGYLCDVELDVVVSLPYVGEQQQQGIRSLRFIETADGWSAVQN